MNRERVYCFPYLTRYVLISRIEIEMKICEGINYKEYNGIILGEGGFGETSYPETKFFHEFS